MYIVVVVCISNNVTCLYPYKALKNILELSYSSVRCLIIIFGKRRCLLQIAMQQKQVNTTCATILVNNVLHVFKATYFKVSASLSPG